MRKPIAKFLFLPAILAALVVAVPQPAAYGDCGSCPGDKPRLVPKGAPEPRGPHEPTDIESYVYDRFRRAQFHKEFDLQYRSSQHWPSMSDRQKLIAMIQAWLTSMKGTKDLDAVRRMDRYSRDIIRLQAGSMPPDQFDRLAEDIMMEFVAQSDASRAGIPASGGSGTIVRGLWGPQGNETQADWENRLAANIWQTTYDRVLLKRAQDRANAASRGMRNMSSPESIARDDEIWAKYEADNAAKSARTTHYQQWLKTAPETELMQYNMHRDGSARVAYGVPKRGSGMGPTLDWSKPDAAEARNRASYTRFNNWLRNRTARSKAENAWKKKVREEQRQANSDYLKAKRIARGKGAGDAQPAAPGAVAPQPATPRGEKGKKQQPATATWTDADGTVHRWTSSGGKRTLTSTTKDGKTSTEVRGGGPDTATSYRSDGTEVTSTSSGGGKRRVTTTPARGRTSTRTSGGGPASVTMTDEDGNVRTVTEDGKGNRRHTVTTPDGETHEEKKPSRPAAPATGGTSWTDADGARHRVKIDADGNKTETTYHKNGDKTRRTTRRDGTVTEISIVDGKKTRTVTHTDGTTVQTSTLDDGSVRTVVTDPKTGVQMVKTEHTILYFTGDRGKPGSDGTTVEVRDKNGKVIGTGARNRNGSIHYTTTDEDGNLTITSKDGFGRVTTTTVDSSGWGTETVVDEDGNVISTRKVIVETGADEDGNTVVTTYGQDGGKGVSETLEANGRRTFNDHVESETHPGRHLFEAQKKDLGLSSNWDDLSQKDKDGYNAEQERRNEVAQHREREKRKAEEWKAALEAQKKEDIAAQKKADKELAEKIAKIQADHDAREARIENDKIAKQQADIAKKEKKEAERIRIEEDAAREEAFNKKLKDEGVTTVTDMQKFQLKLIRENMTSRRDAYQKVVSTGMVSVPDGKGGYTQRPASRSEREAALTKVGLIDNLNSILDVEDANRVAQLNVAKGYVDLISRNSYDGDPRTIVGDANRQHDDQYDISDLRRARRKSGNAVVEALEQRALIWAGVATHKEAMDGVLSGVEGIARALNDTLCAFNPMDPFVQAALGVKTSGPDIGRELNGLERVGEFAKGTLDLATGRMIGHGLKRLQEGTGTTGTGGFVGGGARPGRLTPAGGRRLETGPDGRGLPGSRAGAASRAGRAADDTIPPPSTRKPGLAAHDTLPPPAGGPVSRPISRAAPQPLTSLGYGQFRPDMSSSERIRRMFTDVENRARGAAARGDNVALDQARRDASALSSAAKTYEGMNPAQRGIANESMEILRRLRRVNPDLRARDPYGMVNQATLHSHMASGNPVDVALRVTTFGRADVTVKNLARAANISEPNAYAAVRKGWESAHDSGIDVAARVQTAVTGKAAPAGAWRSAQAKAAMEGATPTRPPTGALPSTQRMTPAAAGGLESPTVPMTPAAAAGAHAPTVRMAPPEPRIKPIAERKPSVQSQTAAKDAAIDKQGQRSERVSTGLSAEPTTETTDDDIEKKKGIFSKWFNW